MRRRGFTVPEILVAAFLGLVVLGMMAQILVPSMLMFRVQSARSDVQQAPLAVVHCLSRALLNTQVESITVLSAPTAVCWREVDEDAPFDISSGRPRLRPAFSVLYHEPSTKLVWIKRWPPDPPSLPVTFAGDDPPLLSADRLRSVVGARNGTERVLARNVTALTVAGDDPGASLLVLPLRVSVTCVAPDRDDKLTLTARVSPRSVRW